MNPLRWLRMRLNEDPWFLVAMLAAILLGILLLKAEG